MIFLLLLCNHYVDINLFTYSWIATVTLSFFMFLMLSESCMEYGEN